MPENRNPTRPIAPLPDDAVEIPVETLAEAPASGSAPAPAGPAAAPARPMAKEIGGRDGPEPTRYGDWEKKGIISDF